MRCRICARFSAARPGGSSVWTGRRLPPWTQRGKPKEGISAAHITKRALAYIRVSTDEQAQEGFSLPHQRERLEAFCRSQGWHSTALYVDDGYSAKDLDRPALTRLRADASEGDVVVVLRLDRLTRSVPDLYALLSEWDSRGAVFRSATEPYDTASSQGRFMLGLLALLAQWERERLSERVYEVMRNIVQTEGRRLGMAPLGYDMVDSQLVINELEARLVRLIFRLYLERWGMRKIAQHLNEDGHRTKSGHAWTMQAVSYVLRNPIYAGKLSWGNRRNSGGPSSPLLVDAPHQPILEVSTWQAAQETAARRRTMPARMASGRYPLTGVAWCGQCGGRLAGSTKGRRGKPGPQWYRCLTRVCKGTCSASDIRADVLETRVLERLSLTADPAVLAERYEARVAAEERATAATEAEEIRAEMQELAPRIRRWEDAYEEGMPAASISARLAPLIARREALARRLAEAEKAGSNGSMPDLAAISRRLADIPRLWQHMSQEERKALMHLVVDRITVGPDGTVDVVPRF